MKSSVKDAEEKSYVWVFADQASFENAFGMATTASSKPTTINFEKESVVALAAPKTKVPTMLSMNVAQQGSTVTVKYKMKPESDKESFVRRPVTLVAIPKAVATGKEVVVYDNNQEVQRIQQ
ncbi:MAG: hypothetical protein LH606_00375 [Cytophagaceae bacterium]|nr:hypothetical protein [Cytophagaceae bacterium]